MQFQHSWGQSNLDIWTIGFIKTCDLYGMTHSKLIKLT